MNACNQLLWIIGLGMAATMAVAETPPTSRLAATGTEMPVPDPTRVWNSESRADVSSIPAKIRRYAERVVKKLDRNGSGALEAVEWTLLPGDPRQIDANHDGVITVDELAAYLARYARLHPFRDEATAWRHLPQPPPMIFQPVTPADHPPAGAAAGQEGMPASAAGSSADGGPAARGKSTEKGQVLEDLRRGRKYYVSPAALPSGLPDWFIERDKNGDGQLTLDEFAPDGSAAERRRFHELDKNGDGVITPDEVVGPAKTSLAKEKPETKTSAEKKQPSSSAKPSGGSPSH
jgi:hypothetical protein